jgi:hypothetical protein
MLFKKKRTAVKEYDKENLEPVIRCSICTGEQVAGFLHRTTGRFTEISLIQSESDLDEFKKTYGITQMRKIY